MLHNIRIELSRKELENNTHNRIQKDIKKGVTDEVTPFFLYALLIIFIVIISYLFSGNCVVRGIKNQKRELFFSTAL